MTCPEMDRLIELGLDLSRDPEREAHIQACSDCQEDLGTIRALAGTGAESREVSEQLIARILSELPAPEEEPRKTWGMRLQPALTWGLGFLTALLSTIATGSAGVVGPMTTLLLSSGFGVVTVFAMNREVLDPELAVPRREGSETP